MSRGSAALRALITTVLLAGASTVVRGDTAPFGLGPARAPGQILSGETAERLIHFTFDDGPDPRTTPKMLDALDAAGAKATLFFSASRFRGNGSAAQRARQLALEVRSRGHNIGSHSVDHKRMRPMRAEELDAQLNESDRLFQEIFGQRTYLFRPPWGSHAPLLDQKLSARSDTLVMWNLGMADWVERPPQELADSFMRRLERADREHGQRGGIVLMHDIHAWSVAAFPLIVGALHTRSCQLLEQHEAPYQITDDLAPWMPGYRAPQGDSAARARAACGR